MIAQLLAEQQQLTAVERFSQKHADAMGPAMESFYRDLIPLSEPGPGEQYTFEVDLDACSGCKACVSGCHNLNGLAEGESWRDVGLLLGDDFQQHVTTACHHCLDPACANGCPTLAYEKDPVTGIVRHLDDQCIGCQYCVLKCPYDVPKFEESRGIVRKCDMCRDRLAEGEAPACVQACPNEAISIRVVKNDEVQGDGRQLLASAVGSGYTRPTTRFVGERVRNASMVRSGDTANLTPQPFHWPLVWMLTATQVAVGFQAAAFILGNSGLAWLGCILGALGVGGSVLHLGRPLHAWKAFLGLRKSWLSREIVAFGAWIPLAGLFALTSSAAFGIGALAAGLVSVVCSVIVYVDTRRLFWSAERTFLRFFGTVFVAALSIVEPMASAVLILVLLGEATNLRGQDFRSTSVLWRRLKPITIARFGFALGGLIFLFVSLPIGLGLILTGEFLGRALFFGAVTAPKTVGGLTS